MLPFWKRKDRAEPRPAPRVADGERIYAVGDIHGRLDLLQAMIARITRDIRERRDERRPRLVFLGDYVDRGDDSRGVLDALTRLTRVREPAIVFLRGNHEDALERFLGDPVGGRDWLAWGGEQTLASYGVSPPSPRAGTVEIIEARDRFRAAFAPHRALIESLRTHVVSGSVVFTHAGLEPGVAPEAQDPAHFVWGHPAFLADVPLPGYRVVHGHFDAASPVSLAGRVCVDTGAYYSGTLTALRLDEGEAFLTVSARGKDD